jgi:hypothetical protein
LICAIVSAGLWRLDWFSNKSQVNQEAVEFHKQIAGHLPRAESVQGTFDRHLQFALVPLTATDAPQDPMFRMGTGSHAVEEMKNASERYQQQMTLLQKDLAAIKPGQSEGAQNLYDAYAAYFTHQKTSTQATATKLIGILQTNSSFALNSLLGPKADKMRSTQINHLEAEIQRGEENRRETLSSVQNAERYFSEKNGIQLVDFFSSQIAEPENAGSKNSD